MCVAGCSIGRFSELSRRLKWRPTHSSSGILIISTNRDPRAPFYEEGKVAFYAWLVFPGISGFAYLFRRHLHPLLVRHRARIESSVEQMVDIGKRLAGGAGLERLAELVRSSGIPVGSGEGSSASLGLKEIFEWERSREGVAGK